MRCHTCGRFCKPYDSEINFGCSLDFEPLDPIYYCKRCSKVLEYTYYVSFCNGIRCGAWQKSKAEINAAKKYGVVWLYNSIGGKYQTYVTADEYKKLITATSK